jgi:hypothetical protein
MIGELMGQQPPGTAGTIHVTQGIDHFAQVQLGGGTGPASPPHPGLNHGPLLIGQIGGIRTARLWRAHLAFLRRQGAALSLLAPVGTVATA